MQLSAGVPRTCGLDLCEEHQAQLGEQVLPEKTMADFFAVTHSSAAAGCLLYHINRKQIHCFVVLDFRVRLASSKAV